MIATMRCTPVMQRIPKLISDAASWGPGASSRNTFDCLVIDGGLGDVVDKWAWLEVVEN